MFWVCQKDGLPQKTHSIAIQLPKIGKNARRIINGLDKTDLIKDYALSMLVVVILFRQLLKNYPGTYN
jgi:hypothetical protein